VWERWGNAYKILVGKPESKKALDRPSRRYEVNIKMDIKTNML
jgi:hypothetical protein